jgi:hypothetical protein
MIARLVAAAHVTVHAGCVKTLRQWRTEQQMIDAQTGVATEGVPEILPERVDPLIRMQSPQRVGPALRDKGGDRHPVPRARRARHRPISPARRRRDRSA